MLSIATPDDLQEVCDLLRVMHAENGVGRVNENKALGVITQRISEGGVLISRKQSHIVGTVAMYRDKWWYSDETAFFDQWFFVHPSNRTEGHATRFLAALKQMGRNTGCPVVLQVGTTVDALTKLKFFRKHLTPFGGSFIFDPRSEARAA